MSWRMLAKPITTAEMGTADVFQRITMPPAINRIMKAATVGVVFYNDPAFTNLHVRIYANNAGVPGTLIATSAAWAKADLITLDHAYKAIGFTFSTPVNLAAGGIYHFVLFATAYTGDATSHIAWRLSYPDPQYRDGLTLDAAHGDNHPYELSIIGSEI